MRTYRWYVGRIRALVRSDLPDWDASTVATVVVAWEGLATASRQQRGAILRGLLHHGGRDDLVRHVPRVRRPQGVPRPAATVVVVSLWDLPLGPERRCALLAAYAGLRVMECAGLRWRDVSLDDGTVVVKGKGGKWRPVPVGQDLLEELRRWYGSAGRTPWVVVDALGRPYMPQSLDRRVNAALPPGVTAHMLRHWFGTMTYRACRDLLTVQRLMGHSSPATTAGYVLLDDRDGRAAVASLPSRPPAGRRLAVV